MQSWGRVTRAQLYLCAHGCVVAGLLLLALLYGNASWRPEHLVYSASLLLTSVSAWLLWSWYRAHGSIFDPYGLFLVAGVVFHAGHAILEVFHLNRSGVGTSWGLLGGSFPPQTMVEAMFLATIALACVHMGGLFAVAFAPGDGPSRLGGDPNALLAARYIGWVLVAISFLPAVLMLKDNVSRVWSAGYLALYDRAIAVGVENWKDVLSSFLVPGALMLLVGSNGRRLEVVVSSLCVVGTAVIWTFLGARSYAIMPLLAYGWVWHRQIRKLPMTVLAVTGAVILGVVFPTITMTRKIAGSERLSLELLVTAYTGLENPLIAILNEMGSTLRTVAYTLELVPATRPFDWGAGYLHALLNIFPNFLTWLHFELPYGLPRHWVTWAVNPSIPPGSFGYSFIAEAYLSFGWFGMGFMLFLIGFLVARLSTWGATSAVRMVFAATIVSSLPHFVRGEAEEMARPVVWYALLPCVMVVLLSRYGFARRAAAPRITELKY